MLFFVIIAAPAASAVANATTVTVPAAAPAVIATIITAIPDYWRSWVLHISGILSSLRVLVTVCLYCGYL